MVGDRASRDGGAVTAGITTLILHPSLMMSGAGSTWHSASSDRAISQSALDRRCAACARLRHHSLSGPLRRISYATSEAVDVDRSVGGVDREDRAIEVQCLPAFDKQAREHLVQ